MDVPTQPGLAAALDRAGSGWRPWPVLIALCLVLWLPGFFSLPPSDRDESRFAQASKQMLESGDYVDIRNGLVARNQKPIGIYWLQAPFAAAARRAGLARGNPIWPYRAPSLLGGLVAVLATYGFGRRLVGRPAALLGAAMLAASVILTVEVHMAKTDAALLGATTLALGVLSRAYLEPRRVRWPAALLFWVALGAAVLIKGPIAPMVAGLAALWLAIADRRSGAPRWLAALRPRWGVAVLLAIVLPWFAVIGIATHGRFFAQSVGGDLAGKLAGSDDAHGAMFGTHLLLLPVLMLGGGIAALSAAGAAWRDRRVPEIRFLAAWIVPSWLVFEIVATKLPHYTLPLYPAVALLAARWMLAPAGRGGGARLACGAAIGIMAGLGIAAAALPEVAAPGLHPIDLLGAPALAVAALTVAGLCRLWPDPRRSLLLMLAAAPLLYGAVLGIELPLLAPLWIAPRVAAAVRAYWPEGRPAGAGFGELGFAEPSLMFLCGTDTRHLPDAAAAAAFLAAGAARLVVVGDRDLPALRARLDAAGTAVATLGSVPGYNYSRGRRVVLTLLAGAAPGMPPGMPQRIK